MTSLARSDDKQKDLPKACELLRLVPSEEQKAFAKSTQIGLQLYGGFTRRLTILVAIVLVAASCSPEEEAPGSTNKCATDLYPSYNPKVLDQCAAVCIKCDRGNRATCSTSCTLKGAR
jgi:hypothetical protein